MVPAPVIMGFLTATVPILLDNLDPTYFFFRFVTWLPPFWKIIIRVMITLFFTVHGLTLIFGFVLYLLNSVLPIHTCLTYITNPKLFQHQISTSVSTENQISNLHFGVTLHLETAHIFTKVGNIAKFRQYFRKYQELQILNVVLNQVIVFILPVGLQIGVLAYSVFGYIVIKLIWTVPFPLSILSASIMLLTSAASHFLYPICTSLTLRSEKFAQFWKLQQISASKRKMLDSCRVLRIRVGPFYAIGKSSKATYMSLLLYYTITLVISI